MKNTQVIIWGAVLLFVVVGLSFLAKDNRAEKPKAALSASNGESTASNGASVLAATESFFDFGTIKMRDGKVSRVFELRNEGKESVKIQSIYTSCMCTEAFVSDSSGKKNGPFGMPGHTSPRTNITVGAGELVSVEAVFDPAAHGPSGVGLAERSIYLETNSEEKPRIELKFKAVVTR